jgi:hypothetical protein
MPQRCIRVQSSAFTYRGCLPVHAAGITDYFIRDAERFRCSGYIFFRLEVFFAVFFDAFAVFLDFFTFLAMFPSAHCNRTFDMHAQDYTINPKLILSASNRVNGHPASCLCNFAKHSSIPRETAFAAASKAKRHQKVCRFPSEKRRHEETRASYIECYGTSVNCQIAKPRSSNGFLLRGLQVRILLGSPSLKTHLYGSIT